MHALRQAPVTIPKVESGLFGNHNTIGLRIACAKVFKQSNAHPIVTSEDSCNSARISRSA